VPTDDLKERILDVAMELAADGGFENVRQRDVAAGAGIALGTLYKRFRSKEDILSALLEREAAVFEKRIRRKPPAGASKVERLGSYYQSVTRTLCRKPQLARAMLRAMASGDEHAASNVVKYHGRMIGLVIYALRGDGDGEPTAREVQIATLLQHVWFAALVGWAAGFQTQKAVVEMMRQTAEITLRGTGVTP
jgi:AcrR family transcriptional regulator